MNDIVQMSKGGTNFYPQTKVQAVIGLPDFSTFEKSSDVQTAISNAIKGITPTDLSNYPTKSEMTTAITNATPNVSSFVTMAQVPSAITKATEGLSPDLTNYLTKDETVTQITSAVNSAIVKNKPDLSNYQTSTQVQTAIINALKDYLNTEDVQAKIAEQIKASQPDLSNYQTSAQVQTAISNAIKGITEITPTDLSNYPTKSDVTTEISNAVSGAKPDLSNYPTKSDVTTEISEQIKANQPDLSGFQKASDVQTAITSAIKGITPTADLSNYTTKSDVTTEISNAISKLKPEFDLNKVGETEDNLLLKTDVPVSLTGNNTANQLQQIYGLSRRLEAGTTVTLSFDAVSTAPTNFTIQNDGSDGGTWMQYIVDTVDTIKKHFVATITLDGYSQQDVELHLDNVPSTTTITISNMKLQLGSHETGYSINPEDILTSKDFQTAIASALGKIDISQTMNDSTRNKLQNMNKEMGS